MPTGNVARLSRRSDVSPASFAISTSDAPVTIIEPTNGWRALDLRELWRFRELLYFLDLARHQGALQANGHWRRMGILQPFLTMIIFSVIFGRLAKIGRKACRIRSFPTGPSSLDILRDRDESSGTSLVSTRTWFEDLFSTVVLMPMASVLAAALDFGSRVHRATRHDVYFGIVPGLALVTIPLFLLLAFMTALGVSLWLSALT